MNELVPTARGAVQAWHCDHMGHMNVMWYVGRFDEATWNLLTLIGLSGPYFREQQRGMVAVDQRLQYRRELLAGDTFTIASGVTEIKPKSLLFFHEMRHAASGEIAATARLTGVHLDTASRKSVPFTAVMLEKAQEFLRPYDFGDRA